MPSAPAGLEPPFSGDQRCRQLAAHAPGAIVGLSLQERRVGFCNRDLTDRNGKELAAPMLYSPHGSV